MGVSERTKELDLPGLTVTNMDPNCFEARLDEPDSCPICGSSNFCIEHMNREKKLQDLLNAKDLPRVIDLCVLYTYYRCRSTIEHKQRYFPRSFSFSEAKRPYTCRLERYVFHHFLTTEATALSRGEVIKGKLSKDDINGIFEYITTRLDGLVPQKIAPVETMLIHKSLIKNIVFYSVCNLADGMLIEILQDCSVESIKSFAKRMDLSELKTVWIDIDDRLLLAVKETFPDAEICSGKYAVEQFIRRQLPALATEFGADKGIKNAISKDRDFLSKYSKERLDGFLAIHSELKAYYNLQLLQNADGSEWTIEQIVQYVDSIPLDSPGLFGLKASLCTFTAQLRSSIGKSYQNKQLELDMMEIVKDHLESIDHSHDELRKTSAKVMRARAFYSELSLEEPFLEDLFDEHGKIKSENEVLFEKTVKRDFRTRASGRKGEQELIGQPLEEVDSRMKRLVEVNKEEKRKNRNASF